MPRFQGQAWSTLAAKARAEAVRPELAAKHLEAVQAAGEKYRAEIGGSQG
jgi:limonene 1,2-monooxygenase